VPPKFWRTGALQRHWLVQMLLDSLAASPYFVDVLFQLLVSVVSDVNFFAKVLLKSIEYFWAKKVLARYSTPSKLGGYLDRLPRTTVQ